MSGVCLGRVSTVLVLALVSILAGRADGRTWVVAQDGSGDYAFVRQACLAAASGDSVIVKPGTYQESDSAIYLKSKPLSILGAGAGPDDVRLQLAFYFRGCDGVLLENLSFVDNEHAFGFSESRGTVRNCAVRHCVSRDWSSAVGNSGAELLIEDSVFDGNRKLREYIPEFCTGGAIEGELVTIRNCLFVDNAAAGEGGGSLPV